MQALVHQRPGKKSFVEHAKPTLEKATDAIVKITKTIICGIDLHILGGDVSTCTSCRILGHEGAGIIESVGSGVTALEPGGRVRISCITACGRCEACRSAMDSHCSTGGWMLGNTIDGTQAEFARIPHADTSSYVLPDGIDEEDAVMMSDILPTGLECGVLNGKVAPGRMIAIVGSGSPRC